MSYYGFFSDTTYRVVDGNIVYAADLNNPMSALKTGIAGLVDSIQTGAVIKTASDTGVVNAYVLNLTASPSTLVDGLEVWLKPSVTNTGPATVNVNSLGAKTIRTTLRTALAGGELIAGYPFLLKYVASIDSWLVASNPGSTEIDATRTITGGDGLTITSDEDSILIELTDGGISTTKLADDVVTTDKIADSAVTQDKIASLPDIVHNDILGGDVTKTGANELTVGAVSCWDSTRAVWLEKATTTTVTIPETANTMYHLAVVRLVSDGSISVLAYISEAAIASDSTVNAHRWLIPWCTNGSNNCEDGYLKGDYFTRTKASEAVLSTGITTSYATVDHTAKVYTDRAELIQYGCRDASVSGSNGGVTASLDGTNLAYTVGYTQGTVDDTSIAVWGGGIGLMPFIATMQFKSVSGTLDLLARVVKYRR